MPLMRCVVNNQSGSNYTIIDRMDAQDNIDKQLKKLRKAKKPKKWLFPLAVENI